MAPVAGSNIFFWRITKKGFIMNTISGFDDKTNGWNKSIVQRMGGVDIADAFLRGEYELKPIALLIMVGTVTIAPTMEAFVTGDKFVINSYTNPHPTAKVKISSINFNFASLFFGKSEELFTGSELHYQKLTKKSLDAHIIAELGGETKAETTLTEMFYTMEKQPNGEAGALLTNGYANIFYIRDVNGVIYTVYVRQVVGGWSVYSTSSFVYKDKWPVSVRVFSRNSVTV